MIIKCDKNKFQICNIKGIVPEGHDCLITGFHIVNGKIIKKGEVEFIENGGGKSKFILKDNIIENKCWN